MGSRGWRSSRPPGSAARAAGKVRIEGKDSVMQDGDVVEFRHS
jgi:ribosome-binding ATPase YchF (GTP1/OBG family)